MSGATIFWAYIFSALVAVPVTWGWSKFLFWCLDKRVPTHDTTERIEWIPVLVGIIERTIVTTLIIWTPKLIPAFIGGWMALKVAGGWGLLRNPTTRNRATFFIGLLGNVVSLGWAIAVGVYVSPGSLDLLNK